MSTIGQEVRTAVEAAVTALCNLVGVKEGAVTSAVDGITTAVLQAIDLPISEVSDRDELAALLNDHLSERDYEQGCRLKCGYSGDDRDEHLADAILATGYRKPRTVTTIEELDALPLLTVIRDSDGSVHERLEWDYGPALQWTSDGAEDMHPKLPATVLYTPEEAGRG
ncbi:hypothetical protein P3H15_27380 [Rhodococcus sp. T2V]|uniref:hypothetical protein n=1 Tax=Rhodococcus sp. T2V TaxID=3034164 RepID=UPI0023E162E7|nr:hypothetical protein [Rhodococcus sp. T2V]MDF3308745.1 hypothetical protein [Rhodococcus sp. T2V]